MGLVIIITVTIAIFFILLGRFLFKYLFKFYLQETSKIINYFNKENRNFGELLLTLLIAIFTGVLAFVVYKTMMVLVAYLMSDDLVDFFIKNRGVFASSRVALQNPFLFKNLLYGLIFSPLAQFFSVFLMIKIIQIFMNELNRRANDKIYSASSLVYFSTISLVVFVVIELFAYSQSITIVSTFTNIVLLIGAKLGYILFFYSILHVELVKNENYRTALHNDWKFNKVENKLISNNIVLLTTSLILVIVLNFPLYSGFQFSSNNWYVLLKLVFVGGVFYVVLLKTFAKGFDYIGIYMIDDTRVESIPSLNILSKKTNLILASGFVILSLVLVIFSFKSLMFFSFFMFVFLFLSLAFIYLVYIIGWKIKESQYKSEYIKSMISSFSYALIPAILFMLFAFTLLNVKPKNVETIKYTHYQKNIIDNKGNILYFNPSVYPNPSSPIAYEKLPDFFIKALIAKEDRGFFRQNSWFFNKRNWHGISSTGRSNIDQQLIKNWAFEGAFPQEMQRKFSEFITSYQLSINQSPEAILTHYVNTVSFNGGAGHSGIMKASYHTFGRSITNINELEQLYLLFTLHRGRNFKLSENKYIPYNEAYFYKDEVKKRLLLIAKNWKERGWITKKEFKKLKKQNFKFQKPILKKFHDKNGVAYEKYILEPFKLNSLASTNTFFSNCIKNSKKEEITFESSITLKNQNKMKLAVERFKRKFNNHLVKDGNQLYASAIVIDVKTGQILSHYGGNGINDMSQFGDGSPIGSIIKPFVLLELLEQGYKVWLFDGKRKGRRLLRNYNMICSEKYLDEVGILKPSKNTPLGNIFETTEPIPLFLKIEEKFSKMGIHVDPSIDLDNKNKKMEHTLNYPIGSRRMTLYSIAQSYQVLFNQGKYIKLSTINKSFDPYELKETILKKDTHSIYKKENVNKITDALKTVLEPGGTAYSLNKYLPKSVQFMAKTGTTDEFRHGYTVLSDGETLVVSWVSYGKEIDGILKFNQTAIPNKSGGSSAGVLAAFIFNEWYK